MLNSTVRSRLPQRLSSRSRSRPTPGNVPRVGYTSRGKRAIHNIFRHLTFDWAHYTVAVVVPSPSLSLATHSNSRQLPVGATCSAYNLTATIYLSLPAGLPLSLSFPASRFQLVQSVCYKIRLSSWLMAKDFSCMCVCGGLLKILAKISKRQCFITCLCFVRRFVYCVVYLARVLH